MRLRELLADLGGLTGCASILWGLWGIYWPLAAIAGGATLLAVCVLVAKWDSSRR